MGIKIGKGFLSDVGTALSAVYGEDDGSSSSSSYSAAPVSSAEPMDYTPWIIGAVAVVVVLLVVVAVAAKK